MGEFNSESPYLVPTQEPGTANLNGKIWRPTRAGKFNAVRVSSGTPTLFRLLKSFPADES